MLTTSYARKEIALTLLIGLAVTAVTGTLWGLSAIVPLVITLVLLSFYRDPPRRIPAGEGLVLAPADGRIVAIERDLPGPDGQGRWLRIMTFLAVYNGAADRLHGPGGAGCGRWRADRYDQTRFAHRTAAARERGLAGAGARRAARRGRQDRASGTAVGRSGQ
jgi:hypothetical protein